MQNRVTTALLTILFTSLVYADTEQKTENKTENKTNHLIEDFAQQWGLAAIKIPAQQGTPSVQEWSGNILTQPLNNSNINNTEFQKIIFTDQLVNSINAAYHFGRFHAKTGLLSQSSDVLDSGKFYLQGSFSVYIKDKFDLALTAKFEATDSPYINTYNNELIPSLEPQNVFDYNAKQATIGIMSTYSINKQWTLLGAFTTTTFDKSQLNEKLIDINNTHMALIGTTYSF
jgi:hypothetical protein